MEAVMVIGKEPLCVGVPESRPEELRDTPFGSVEAVEKPGAGNPVAVTWKLLLYPWSKVALVALVKEGALPICREMVLVSGVPTPLEAVNVRV